MSSEEPPGNAGSCAKAGKATATLWFFDSFKGKRRGFDAWSTIMANQDKDQTKNMGGQNQGMGGSQETGTNKFNQGNADGSADTMERNPSERAQGDRKESDENQNRDRSSADRQQERGEQRQDRNR
jgi:hypothetical protein